MLSDSNQPSPELSDYEKDLLAWNLPRPVSEPRPARPRMERGGEGGEQIPDEPSRREAA